MGAIFKLERANIMAYITSRSYGPPRVSQRLLGEFLEVLRYSSHYYLISEQDSNDWPRKISMIADQASNQLRYLSDAHGERRYISDASEESLVPPSTVDRVLEGLRTEFADFPLYALAVGTDDYLKHVARDLARMPLYGQLLVLIPETSVTKRNFEVLDPVPSFSAALHAAPDWPGFLFWTQTGVTAFVKLNEVSEFVHWLIEAAQGSKPNFAPWSINPSVYDHALREWSKRKQRRNSRLLHLSDLHFGTKHATENQALLEAELRGIVQSVDRVVITGDLTNTPKNDFTAQFNTFRNNITHLAKGREPISITGNHDQRMIGLFGEDYSQVAKIGSRKIDIDDQAKMIFICFNSSEKGSLARGEITTSQFRQLGGDYHTLIASRPELKSYLPIVLVHHHPFSFDVQPETWVQRVLSATGFGDENFLTLVEPENLHNWCADWNIKTILHGHKHKARYIEKKVGRRPGDMILTAIGCGSSLGAEGSPVSYNMLEWDPYSRRWVASFFESINGGAFRETVAAVSPHQ